MKKKSIFSLFLILLMLSVVGVSGGRDFYNPPEVQNKGNYGLPNKKCKKKPKFIGYLPMMGTTGFRFAVPEERPVIQPVREELIHVLDEIPSLPSLPEPVSEPEKIRVEEVIIDSTHYYEDDILGELLFYLENQPEGQDGGVGGVPFALPHGGPQGNIDSSESGATYKVLK